MDKNLVDLVRDAGIIGAGGAGFPTHAKISAKAEYVIVNGAECEPLLRVDQQLMDVRAEQLLEGLRLLMEQTGASHGVVALKGKYHGAVDSLNAIIDRYPGISLHIMGSFYPAGDEQVIVYEVTGRIVPEGGIPLNVGVIVSNAETILNVYDAYYSNQPVVDTYITLTGEVKNRITVKVPLGITVREAIDLAGGATVTDYVVINGGPMMGKVVSPDSFITKTTKGLIVLPAGHSMLCDLNKSLSQMLREAKTSCMHCSLCTEVCPRNLIGHRIEPHKMIRVASYGSMCDVTVTPMNAFLCCGCRLCEYACVMNLQPWKLNNELKQQMGANGIRNELHAAPEKAHPFREYKKYPVKKLIHRLGLQAYDVPAPITACDATFPRVTLSLKQSIGAPGVPVVQPGDTVNRGDLVAEIAEGKLGSRVHASISGTVVSVDAQNVVIQA